MRRARRSVGSPDHPAFLLTVRAEPDSPSGPALALTVRGWIVLAAGWALAAIAVALSTELSLVTQLVFHFHPIAVVAGSAWVYRRLNGERPCPVHTIAFLLGLGALLSPGAAELTAAGLADPPWLAVPIVVTALLVGGWILLRPDVRATVPSSDWRR